MYRSLCIVFCPFVFFLSLCCLFLFDLLILITTMISLNVYSYKIDLLLKCIVPLLKLRASGSGNLMSKGFNFLDFQSFDSELNRWRLFQKHVVLTKLDIYVICVYCRRKVELPGKHHNIAVSHYGKWFVLMISERIDQLKQVCISLYIQKQLLNITFAHFRDFGSKIIRSTLVSSLQGW